MAKKRRKSTAAARPRRRSRAVAAAKPRRRRASGGKRTTRRRSSRRPVAMAGFGGMLQPLLMGIAGAVGVTKFGRLIPIQNDTVRNGVITAGMLLLGAKGPAALRPIAFGAALASGTMTAASVFPQLMAPSNLSLNGIGGMDRGTVERMKRGAEMMRNTMNGPRGRSIVGGPGYRSSIVGGVGRFHRQFR